MRRVLAGCAVVLTIALLFLGYGLWRVMNATETLLWRADQTLAMTNATIHAVAPEVAATATAVRIGAEDGAVIVAQGRRVAVKYADDLTAPKSTGQKVAGVIGTILSTARKAFAPW